MGLLWGYAMGPTLAQNQLSSYWGGAYQVYQLKAGGKRFKVFDVNPARQAIRAHYIGPKVKQKYASWRRARSRQVLCYFEVGFTKDWDDHPLGWSAEKGRFINKTLDPQMDGLILTHQSGQLVGLDIEYERAEGRYQLSEPSARAQYMRRITSKRSSVFQTQLMYSRQHGSRMGEPTLGKKAARRFLALCTDRRGDRHYVILESPNAVYLNQGAQAALGALGLMDYQVDYLFNQDTGSRNVMVAFDDRGREIYAAPMGLENASQILVFYK